MRAEESWSVRDSSDGATRFPRRARAHGRQWSTRDLRAGALFPIGLSRESILDSATLGRCLHENANPLVVSHRELNTPVWRISVFRADRNNEDEESAHSQGGAHESNSCCRSLSTTSRAVLSGFGRGIHALIQTPKERKFRFGWTDVGRRVAVAKSQDRRRPKSRLLFVIEMGRRAFGDEPSQKGLSRRWNERVSTRSTHSLRSIDGRRFGVRKRFSFTRKVWKCSWLNRRGRSRKVSFAIGKATETSDVGSMNWTMPKHSSRRIGPRSEEHAERVPHRVTEAHVVSWNTRCIGRA